MRALRFASERRISTMILTFVLPSRFTLITNPILFKWPLGKRAMVSWPSKETAKPFSRKRSNSASASLGLSMTDE